MKILVMLLCFVSVTFGQTIEGKVKKFEDAKLFSVSYDKFKKTTEVETDIQIKGKSGSRTMTAWLSFAGDPLEPDVYLVSFDAERHSFFNQPTLRFLVDDIVYKLESDRVSEVATFIVEKNLWKAFSTAKTVELQLKRYEGSLDAKNLKRLQNLASLIK